jgi:hypothetical protein
MAEITSMLEANERFAEGFDAAGLPMPPKRPATGEDVSGMRFETFSDLDESVAEDVGRLRSLAILPEGVTVAGYVYDVDSGRLREVVPVGSG